MTGPVTFRRPEGATVPRTVTFRPFLAGDVVQLALQPSQHVALGLYQPVLSIDYGRELEAHSPTAWTAQAGGRILACAGLQLQWPASDRTGGHALAWALFTTGLGAAHVAITRHFRKVVADDPASRVEAIVRADVDAEVRFAELVGFTLAAVLRAWGPEGATHLLYERVRETENCAETQTDRSCLTGRDRSPRLEALGAC
jgi:hypothetical protein